MRASPASTLSFTWQRRSILVIGLMLAGCGSTSPTTSPTQATPAGPSATPAATAPSQASSPSAAPIETTQASLQAVPSGGPIDPANFVAAVDNPWFPLSPGVVMTYRGTKDGETAVDTVTVTKDTKVVAGVPCVVVHDELTLSGKLAETTQDWYVQDRAGNVWYFGEATAELDASGKVASTEGSWESGVDGALPGIFMPAQPEIGQSGVQEVYPGQAEDRYVVLLTDAKVKVPLGTFSGVLLTAEWTTLEPDVLSEKAYVKGTGEVREADVAGGDEKLELVKIVRP